MIESTGRCPYPSSIMGFSVLIVLQIGSVLAVRAEDLQNVLTSIRNQKSSDAEWNKAVEELNKPPEPAKLWTDLANDSRYPLERRRQAIFKLFERHIAPGINLAALGDQLAGAKWLERADVTSKLGPTGVIPLDRTGKGAVYLVVVLQRPGSGTCCIYVRTSRKVEDEELLTALHGEKLAAHLRKIAITEYALCRSSKDSLDLSVLIRSVQADGGETTKRFIIRQ
jgi:hypothetical protein